MTAVSSRYVALADAESWTPRESPFMGLFDERTASLRCFQRYSKEAHRDITDGLGISRWVTQKQARVHGIIARIAMSPDGTAKMVDIALEARCTVSTVSRTIRKLQGWELYAVEVRRGRHGGITVHRKGWDRFFDFVLEARRQLRDARNRASGKLASIIRGRKRGQEPVPEPSPVTSTVMDASFTRKPKSFGDRVLYERAMLALEDPDGEYEAAHPITNVDEALLQAEDERRRRYAAVREAALVGDWERWEALRQAWDVD